MTGRYKAYPEYKDSGARWLGRVPSHWTVLPTKRFFRLVAEPAPKNNDYELLSVYTDIGVKPRKELEQKGNKASSTDGYWMVKKGDIIVNKLLAWMGAVGYSSYGGVTSPAYDILRPSKDFNSRFYHYLFRNEIAQQEFKRWSRGIMEMRLRLYFEELGRIQMPFPPSEEIEQITQFLDHETAKIDTLITKQEKLIELLKEKRHALVYDAINSQDSLRLVYLVEQQFRPFKRSLENYVVALGLYNRGRGIFKKEAKLPEDLGESDFYHVKDGDLIISGQFAWEGAVALADEQHNGCIVSHRYPILRGKSGVLDTKYLWAFLTTRHGDFLLNENSVGSAGRNRPLNIGMLLKEKVPLPSLDKQFKIARFVEVEKEINLRVKQNLDRLNERKTSLISAVVTGKIDVRDWQSQTEVVSE